MIIQTPPVHPWVRIAANLLLASTLAGITAYTVWLCGAPQWAAIIFGCAILAVYGLMWFGSLDDNHNA